MVHSKYSLPSFSKLLLGVNTSLTQTLHTTNSHTLEHDIITGFAIGWPDDCLGLCAMVMPRPGKRFGHSTSVGCESRYYRTNLQLLAGIFSQKTHKFNFRNPDQDEVSYEMSHGQGNRTGQRETVSLIPGCIAQEDLSALDTSHGLFSYFFPLMLGLWGTDILHDVSHTFLVFVWIPQYTINSVPKLIPGLAGEWVPSIISSQGKSSWL